MSETTLAVLGLNITREHRLEDLARRLSKELDIKLNPDEKHHGISVQTWLSGENDKYVIDYSSGLIYEDGPSNDEDESISIQNKPINYPKIVVDLSSYGYDLAIDVPDFLINYFMKIYRVQPSQPVNLFHRTLALRVAQQLAKIKLGQAQSGGMIVYNFRFDISEGQLSELNGSIMEYFLS